MRISDQELSVSCEYVQVAKDRRKERGYLMAEEWPVIEEYAEAALLDLRDLRKMCRAVLECFSTLEETSEGEIKLTKLLMVLAIIREHLEAK